jgi:hypothetical protein
MYSQKSTILLPFVITPLQNSEKPGNSGGIRAFQVLKQIPQIIAGVFLIL